MESYVKLLQRANRRLGAFVERRRLSRRNQAPQLAGEHAFDPISAETTVLFLCLGNICRSPFAERYLRQQLSPDDADSVTVHSAGFLDVTDRPSPNLAIEAAREYGVDLSTHSSSAVSMDLLDESDLVFLMDAENYYLMKRRFPGALDRTFLLKSLVKPTHEWEIADPYGGGLARFRRVYGEISEATDELSSRLAAAVSRQESS